MLLIHVIHDKIIVSLTQMNKRTYSFSVGTLVDKRNDAKHAPMSDSMVAS